MILFDAFTFEISYILISELHAHLYIMFNTRELFLDDSISGRLIGELVYTSTLQIYLYLYIKWLHQIL